MRKLIVILIAVAASSFYAKKQQPALTGAWHLNYGTIEHVWTFIDGYSVKTAYDKVNRKFIYTWGGPYQMNGNDLLIRTEFNTANADSVGRTIRIIFTMNNNKLQLRPNRNAAVESEWLRLDNGTGALAGNWRIGARLEDGKLVESPAATGPRKTLKLLSGTRFQWFAINPEVKGFYGTGGGTYTFQNGKYTEHIEFFSRDSTRVGASLTFDGKVENDAWSHSGLNSRGEPLNEVWRRVKQ